MAAVQASADSNVDVPPAKKYKQATLPFKKVNNGPPLTTPNSKKRKISSDGATPQSQKKTPRRSDDLASRRQQSDDKENEVTSSSEADTGLVEKVVSSKSVRKVGLMDQFVRTTQQQEISTSSTEGPAEDVIMVDDDSHQEPVSSALENCDDNTRCGDEAPATKRTKLQDVSTDESKEENLDHLAEERGHAGCQSLAAFGFCPLPKKEGREENHAKGSMPLGGVVTCNSTEEEVTGEDHVEDSPIKDTDSSVDCSTEPDVKPGSPGSALDSKAPSDISSQTDSGDNVCTSPNHLSNDGSFLKSPEPSRRNSADGSSGTTPVAVSSDSTPTPSQTPGSTPVSKGAPGNTPVSKGTPGSTPVSNQVKQTPSSSIKKQRLEAERQKKKEERDRERQEKQRQREEAKAEKERQRKEEKEKKEREKQEQKEKKEQERKDKMEQKEKERQEKLKAKEEERRKKQEVIDAKNEEKKRMEEEKRKLEEEKRKLEEEKNKKMQKTQMAFQSFFTKSVASTEEQVPKQAAGTAGLFMPFPLKANMRMAPSVRINEEERKAVALKLDQALHTQEETSKLYLSELKSGGSKGRTSGKTWLVDECCQSDVEITDDQTKKPGKRMRVKLLQFKENYRPAYYGTWRKRSKLISPKNPLKMDKELLDYEVDSDDEWEEEEPGESLSDSEGEQGEEEAEDDRDEDDDGFFVPHGYLSDDEGAQDGQDEVMTPDRMKAKQLAKAKAWEAELQRKVTQLRAVILGCIWFDGKASTPEAEELQKFKMRPLVPVDEPIPVSVAVKRLQQPDKPKASGTGLRKPVPEEAMPDLIRLVNGNTCGIQKLMREFRAFWRQKHSPAEKSMGDAASKNTQAEGESIQPDSKPAEKLDSKLDSENHLVSKRQLEMKIKDIAIYEKRDQYRRACWYVKQDILEKYQLADLPIPTQWKFITKAVKSGKDDPAGTPQANVATVEKKAICSKNNPSIAQFTVKQAPGIILAKPQVKQQENSDKKPSETNDCDDKNEGMSQENVPMQVDEAKSGLPNKPAKVSVHPDGSCVEEVVAEVHKEPARPSCEPMEVEYDHAGKPQSTPGKSDPPDGTPGKSNPPDGTPGKSDPQDGTPGKSDPPGGKCSAENVPSQQGETTPLKTKGNAGLLKWLTPKAQAPTQPAQNANANQNTPADGTTDGKGAGKTPQKEGAKPASAALVSVLTHEACSPNAEAQATKSSATSLANAPKNLGSEDVIVLE